MVFWKIATRNVKKNWRHSMSALLSLSASFISLVLFDGYIADLQLIYEDSFHHTQMMGNLVIDKPALRSKEGLAEPEKFAIFPADQQEIQKFVDRHADLIQNRVRFLDFNGMISNGMQSTILLGRGMDVQEGLKMRGDHWVWNATYGIPLHKSTEESAVLIGQGLSRKLGCHFKRSKSFNAFAGGYEPVSRPFECPTYDLQMSLLTNDGQLNALDVTAVGLFDVGYKDIDDRYTYTSLETAQKLMNTPNITMVSLELRDPANEKLVENIFRDELKISGLIIRSWKYHPMGNSYLKTMDLLSIFRNFVILVILVISTLSVANTLIKIIKERSREIGTLRSLGFTPRQVLQLFIYETFLLSALGSAIGLVVSLLLTITLNLSQIKYKAGLLSEPVVFKITATWGAYANAFLILAFVSVFACLISTRQTLNQKIIENLNHV